MARVALVFLACLVAASAIEPPKDITDDADFPAFEQFVAQHHRMYTSQAEVAGRFAIFKDNLRRIAELNAESTEWHHGVNKFADLSPEEFRAKYTGFVDRNATGPMKTFKKTTQAKSIDWRQKGAVTPVKDQGQCGSCWAFSATEQIETDFFLQHGKLLQLSPQQITSCDTTDLGCNGGDTPTAYNYVKKAGGIDDAKDYPYRSGLTGNTGRCKAIKSDFDATVTGFSYVSKGGRSEDQMLQQIQESPMSVCVDATIWQTYQSGIVKKGRCGRQLDHCVQVVGYNADKNYWIVRNSWNTDWGVDGFIFVEAGGNTCGIAEEATIVKTAPVSGAVVV